MPTGAVTALKFVNTSGIRKAFQVSIKLMMPTAARPGAANGTMMRKKACAGVQPSTKEASSSGKGMVRMKPRMIQTTNGRRAAVSNRINVSSRSIMPSQRTTTKIGMSVVIGGKVRGSRIRKNATGDMRNGMVARM